MRFTKTYHIMWTWFCIFLKSNWLTKRNWFWIQKNRFWQKWIWQSIQFISKCWTIILIYKVESEVKNRNLLNFAIWENWFFRQIFKPSGEQVILLTCANAIDIEIKMIKIEKDFILFRKFTSWIVKQQAIFNGF